MKRFSLGVLLAAALLPTAQAQTNWQRDAVPFYGTVQMLQGIYGHWALPRAQDFDRAAQALPAALQTFCSAGGDASAALASARSAWKDTTHAWEQLAAVAVGPVIERRSLRAIDFAPTRALLIERAIQKAPQGAKAFELVGTPAKGLPALEWLLWTKPAKPQTPACQYAYEVAADVAREASALRQAFTQAAQTDWGADEEQEQSTIAISEFINQWVGGIERLRWAQMEKPLRAAQGKTPSDYPRAESGETLASWAATWNALRSLSALPAQATAPVPGQALVPLETFLRGKGLNPLADTLRQAVGKVDDSMAKLTKEGVKSAAAVQQTTRDLAALKFLAESQVASALQVSIGFSDADGD